MIEIILKILLAVFAVFGFYAFVHAFCVWLFRNDAIKLTVLVNSTEVVEQLDLYLEEAKGVQFSLGKTDVFVVVMEKYATNDLLQYLKRKRLSFGVISEKEETV